MSMSLREQLLAAGLGTKKQARQAEREQHRDQHRDRREKSPRAAEQARAAQQAQAARQARDQELNRKRQEKAERKARAAQIRQLIEQHRVPRIESDEYFNFVDGKKIHRIGVDAPTRARIQNGELAVVRYLGFHALVPVAVAEKIREARRARRGQARSAAGRARRGRSVQGLQGARRSDVVSGGRTRRRAARAVEMSACRTWWLYLLACRDGRTYAGVALDVEARFSAHVRGKGARFTRSNPPLQILAAQGFPSKSEALRAEYALKQMSPAGKREWARRWARPSSRKAVASG